MACEKCEFFFFFLESKIKNEEKKKKHLMEIKVWCASQSIVLSVLVLSNSLGPHGL